LASFGDFNRVNTNVTSLGARLSLNKINSELGDSRLKLSTGKWINSAEDNSAGYAIATKLNSRVMGLEQALQNVSDAKSMLDVVENAYNSIIDNLIKLKSLATQAASGTIAAGSDEMAYLASQMEAIGDEINDIADKATFNGKDLIGSSENDTFSIQTGEGNSDIMDIGLSEISMKTIFPANSLQYPNGAGSFFEDFNDGDLSDFNVENNVSIQGGSFDGSNMVTLDSSSKFYPLSLTESYGVYSAKVKSNTSTGNIYLRLTDTAEIQEKGITIGLNPSNSDDPTAVIYNYEHIETDGSVPNSRTNPNFNWNEWADVEVDISRDSVKLSVNNQQLTELELEKELEAGRFKFASFISVSFDNMSYVPGDDNERLIIDEDTVTDSDMRNLMDNIDTALGNMNSKMNELGINQQSLSSKEENLTQAITANSAAHSRIMDTDFAKEQSNSIRLQILQQTATAALSQANMGPQAVLGFLGQ
jgi:flagellin-like hook-associated protein FlgL